MTMFNAFLVNSATDIFRRGAIHCIWSCRRVVTRVFRDRFNSPLGGGGAGESGGAEASLGSPVRAEIANRKSYRKRAIFSCMMYVNECVNSVFVFS